MKARYLLATAAAVYACGSGAEQQSAEGAAGTSSGGQASAASASAAVGATAVPESCDLIPRAEVERIAGRPLQGEPRRDGKGCWYYVAMDTMSAEWKQLRERAERARAGGMDDRAIELYHPTRAGLYVEVDLEAAGERSDTAREGWDETRIAHRSGLQRPRRPREGLPQASAAPRSRRHRRRHREPGPRPHPRRADRAPCRGWLGAATPGPGPLQRTRP